MVKKIAGCIREYKKVSIATPLLVSLEVVMECIIPFIIAELVNKIKDGCDMNTIVTYGVRRAGGFYLRNGFLRSCKESPKGYVLQYPEVFI